MPSKRKPPPIFVSIVLSPQKNWIYISSKRRHNKTHCGEEEEEERQREGEEERCLAVFFGLGRGRLGSATEAPGRPAHGREEEPWPKDEEGRAVVERVAAEVAQREVPVTGRAQGAAEEERVVRQFRGRSGRGGPAFGH